MNAKKKLERDALAEKQAEERLASEASIIKV